MAARGVHSAGSFPVAETTPLPHRPFRTVNLTITREVNIKSLHFLRERADRRGGRRTHVARDTHPPVEVAQHLSGGVTRAAALVARAEEQQLYRLAQRGLARLAVVVERGGLGTGSLPPHLWGKL